MLSSLDWFPVVQNGDDLVVPRAAATWFGGDDDPEDNGLTASGVPTKGNPGLLGCALPLAGYGVKSLRGTPLPMMGFGLHPDGSPNAEGAWAEVTCGLLTLTLPVIDLGPALRTRHGIDLTVAAFKHFVGDLAQGVIVVSYRLKRGGLYLGGEAGHPTSNIQHPTSNIQHPTSNIQRPTSNIQRPTSNVQRPTSNIQRVISNQ